MKRQTHRSSDISAGTNMREKGELWRLSIILTKIHQVEIDGCMAKPTRYGLVNMQSVCSTCTAYCYTTNIDINLMNFPKNVSYMTKAENLF